MTAPLWSLTLWMLFGIVTALTGAVRLKKGHGGLLWLSGMLHIYLAGGTLKTFLNM